MCGHESAASRTHLNSVELSLHTRMLPYLWEFGGANVHAVSYECVRMISVELSLSARTDIYTRTRWSYAVVRAHTYVSSAIGQSLRYRTAVFLSANAFRMAAELARLGCPGALSFLF